MAHKPMPEKFSVSFSMYDNACMGFVEMTLDDLPDAPVVDESDRGDAEHVRSVLRDAADAASDAGLDARAGELSAAADRLEFCAEYRCDCATYSWESEEEYLNELLDSFPDLDWAVLDSGGAGSGFFTKSLTVQDLFEEVRVGSRYGFDELSLSWDGARLDVSFSGNSWGSSALTFVPLVGIRDDAYELWHTAFEWTDSPEEAASIVTGDVDVLHRLCAVDVVSLDESVSMSTLAAIFAGIDAADTAALALAVEMAPQWPHSIDDLVVAVSAFAMPDVSADAPVLVTAG